MKFILPEMNEKEELPSGKLNVRFRQMRCCWQCFAGRTYLNAASGDTVEEAIENMMRGFDVPEGAEIKVHL